MKTWQKYLVLSIMWLDGWRRVSPGRWQDPISGLIYKFEAAMFVWQQRNRYSS